MIAVALAAGRDKYSPTEERMSDPEQQELQEHGDHSADGEHQLLTAGLPTGTWRVSPDGSALNFRTRAILGLLPVSGVFEDFSGEMHVGPDGGTTGRLVVQTGSLETGIPNRDEHLKSADAFYASEFPLMIFTVAAITASGDEHLNLSGSLQIRDRTIPMAFPIYAVAHDDHLHVEGRTVIDHKRAGLGWARRGRINNKVKAQVSLTLNRA